MMQDNNQNPYAPPRAVVDDVQPSVDESPALWNPNAAANWSLLFTPIFGAVVQMKNWQALGESERASKSKAWAIGSFIATVAAIVAAIFMQSKNGADPARTFGLIILILWYSLNGKQQGKYVKEKFGKHYPRRSWWTPLLFGLLGWVGFVVVCVIIGAVITMTHLV